MEEDEYDEYGNYFGETVPSDDEEAEEEDEGIMDTGSVTEQGEIVPHQSHSLYPSASSVFGDDVEIVDGTMDVPSNRSQTGKPIAPLLPKEEILKEKRHKRKLTEAEEREASFDAFVYSCADLHRTVCFVGHLGHGKSSLMTLLFDTPTRKHNTPHYATHSTCNVRDDEKALKVSIKTRPVSASCATSQAKSYWIQAMDTPGHVNFLDEVECALEVSDGTVLCVDVVEGVQIGTELCIRALRRHGLLDSTILCLTKVDRLIHELKLTPSDAHRKLAHVIEHVEDLLERTLSPADGQVLFSSALHGWCISIESMAMLSTPPDQEVHPQSDEFVEFVNLLWGEYFDVHSREFSSSPPPTSRTGGGHVRAFEHFCLNPIYKVYSHVLGGEPEQLNQSLQGLKLSKKEQSMDALPLLKVVLHKVLPSASPSIVDSIVKHVPSPTKSQNMASHYHQHRHTHAPLEQSQGSLLVHCIKHVDPKDDAEVDDLDVEEENFDKFGTDVRFRVLARVYSGTLSVNSRVKVLEPRKNVDDDENDQEEETMTAMVTGIRLPSKGRGSMCYKINEAIPGMLVLLSGVDQAIRKSATLVDHNASRDVKAFPELQLFRHMRTRPVVKVAIEPLVPSELPKMLQGLRAIERSYPSSRIHVEENNGEHVIFGMGELYLDCIMRDLRLKHSNKTEIKICDHPFVHLMETVSDTSKIRCVGESMNGKNSFALIACPLESDLLDDLETERLPARVTKQLPQVLKRDYGYDILSSRSVWGFANSNNLFQDDTLLDDKSNALNWASDSIVQGFRWACQEGPLCEEPVRGCKFKLLDASLAQEVRSLAGPGQVVPTIKRLCHTSMLQANASLVEPVMNFECLVTDQKCLGYVRKALQLRRGGWSSSLDVVAGTRLTRFRGWLPALDSFGLETEIRLKTRGAAFCMTYFDRWNLVPGDPLDESIALRPLEPSQPEQLARDLMVKTRRRKGLPESVDASISVDRQLLQQLVQAGRPAPE